MANGDPIELEAYIISLPAEVALDRQTLGDLQRAGATTVKIYVGPGIWKETGPQTDAAMNTGGATVASLNDVNIGIQRRAEKSTRLAWVKKNANEAFNVEVKIGSDPVGAANLLLTSKSVP